MPTILSWSSWKTGSREKPVPCITDAAWATVVGVLGEHHVDARHHDLARDGVAELEDLVDHALLFVEQRALLGDEELDLLLADTRPAAVESCRPMSRDDRRGRDGEQPHERRERALEPRDRAGDGDGDALGALQAEPLRDELAEDERHVADERA